MQRNNPVNSVYLIALALASLVLFVDSLFTALLYGVVIVCVFLVTISLVSMLEKIADKHVKFLTFALISSVLITVLKLIFGYVNIEFIVLSAEQLDIVVVPCLLLSIIPIYFEESLSVKQFFITSITISFVMLFMLLVYGLVIEIAGYGTIANINLGFAGIEFFRMPYGGFMVIATLAIIFNMVRRIYLKKTRRFNMLVEKYKIQIREIRDSAKRDNKNIGGNEK